MDYFAQVPDWEFHPGDYVRRLRRVADLSQRELAEVTGVSRSTIDRVESGRTDPRVSQLQALLGILCWGLTVTNVDDHVVLPLRELDGDLRDGAERRYPAHLDVILDPHFGDWWGDRYGLQSPPETFKRDRAARDARRARSQFDLRRGPYRRAGYG